MSPAATLVWTALAFGLAGLVALVRERRRRVALNSRMHELRRPLQALALERAPAPAARAGRAGSPDSLELALIALGDLDDEINGRDLAQAGARDREFNAKDLVQAAAIRWRVRAARSGRLIRVRWSAADGSVRADPLRVSQALDNLIANALEHGRGPIVIDGARRGEQLEIAVRDGGGRWSARPRVDGEGARHGHGLRISGAVAARYGGELRVRRGPGQTVASLSFPLSGLRAPSGR